MSRRKPHFDTDGSEEQGPSRTELKQATRAVRDIGAALLDLPDSQLDEIEMEDGLRDALRELRGMHGFEARRRQTQYVDKLLRVADPEPLLRGILAHRQGRTRDALALQAVERWRERLVTEDEALTEWIAAYPDSNTQQFRTLLRSARREYAASIAASEDGEARGKGWAHRELFQKLRAILLSPKELPENLP